MLAAVWILIGAILGYVLGAIPVGYVVCRLYGVDIRTIGSGRTGTTNAWRAAGLKAALPTLLGDALKGAAAIWLLQALLLRWTTDFNNHLQVLVLAITGGMAVIGHNWSLFLGFKGGAGGITAAVTCLALHPGAGIIVCVIGVAMMYWSRIAAIGTFSVGISSLAAFLALAVMNIEPWTYLAFSLLAATGIALSLRPNRAKLKTGDERVVTLW